MSILTFAILGAKAVTTKGSIMFLDRGAVMGSGIVMLVFGIIFLVFPAFSMSFFAVMVGIAFLFGGISMLVSWWKGLRGSTAGVASAAFGVLGVAFALVCIVHPLAIASTLTWLVALCVVIAGISQLVALFLASGLPGRGIGIAATVIMTLFGVFALIWPPMVMQFIGISLIIEGASGIVMGLIAKS